MSGRTIGRYAMPSSGAPTKAAITANAVMSVGMSSSTRAPSSLMSRSMPRVMTPVRRITPTDPPTRRVRKTTLDASLNPTGIAVATVSGPTGVEGMRSYEPATTLSRPSGRVARSYRPAGTK